MHRLSRVFDLFNSDDVDYDLAVMLDVKEKVRNKAARAAFTSYLQLPDQNTRPSALGSTQAHLRFFDSDLVRRLTDTSSMDVSALVAGEPMTLYIIVPPARMTAYRPLLRILLTGLILALTNRTKVPEERTLLMCDEAGNLGRIDSLFTAATLLRSWGLTLWTLWQNVAQLNTYGSQAHTLIDNAGIIQIFGARNLRMAQELANIVGGVSAEQILNLPPNEQMLLIEGRLTRCKQARFYNDELFRSTCSQEVPGVVPCH
jgi:type IV secretion system protein VirD4